jgi:PPP family 3-phenylpropionic acid transporter
MVAITGLGVMLLLVRLPQTFVFLAPLWLMVTALFSPVIPLADSIIARMSLRHGLNYGSMRLWGSVGFALTAVGCGALWERLGFRMMFVIASISLFFVLFLASRLLEESPASSIRQDNPSFREIGQDGGLLILLVTSFFVGASINTSIIFDGIYMSSLGGTGALIGLMFSLAACGELPMMYYRDAIARRLSGPKTLLLSYGLFIMAFSGYALAWHPWMLLCMAMIKGLGFGLFFVSAVQFLNERVPESWASTVQSLFAASTFGLAPLIAAPLGGELYDRFGPKAVFVGGSLFVTGAALIMLVAMLKGIVTEEST